MYLFSSILLALPFLASAQNDWSTPCLNGTCQYSIPATSNGASGTMKIWGDVNAISDITAAAGWEILDCSPDELAQDIRLVCTSEDNSGCNHLYASTGAEGKIIRLPESCGKSAFARVARAWVPEDQSLPSSISARLVGRAIQPEVKALSLDTDFSSVDSAKTGVVNLAIVGAIVPGVDPSIIASASSLTTRNRILAERGLGDFVGDAIDSIKNLDSFDVNKNTALPAIDVNKNLNLFNKSISCPPITASASADANAKAHAVVTLGVAASGTVVPPTISSFSIIAGMNADLTGSIDLKADVSGSLDSGKIKIFEVGIPGLDFPGVLSIGPSFVVNVEAKATLDLNVDMNVALNYHIANAQLVFPPGSQKSGGGFTIGDTPLTLSASPSATATGSVEAHIIPTLNLGISALGNVAKANVFLDLDTSAKMSLSLSADAGASVTANVKRAAVAVAVPPDFYATRLVAASTNAAKNAAGTGTGTGTGTVKGAVNTPTSTKSSKVSVATSASFGGCFDVTSGLSVNAGADAGFFGLFDASTSVPLFNKNFELFKKCFGSQASRRSMFSSYPPSFDKRAGLTCPKADVGTAASVVNENVSAKSIKAV